MKPVGIRGMGKNGRGIIQVWDGGDMRNRQVLK
jgi:hypothetical protein